MAQGNQMRCLSHGHLSGFHTKKYKNINWKRKSIHKTCCVNGSVTQNELCFAFTIFFKHANDVTTTENTSSSPFFVCLKEQKLQTKVFLENTRICDVSLPYVKTGICNISKFWNWTFFPRASERRVLPIVEVCISSSHFHTFSSSHLLSHLLIFTSSLTPSHLHIFSHTFSSSVLLSQLLIFTPSHLHIFSHTVSSSHLLSHLLIFTSSLTPSHLHIFSHTFSSSHLLSHLLIFTSSLTPSHLHTLLSHLLIFTSSLTPSHLHIFSHTFSSSHLLSHLLIFTSSLSLTLSPFSLSFLSPFSLSRLLYLSLFRPRVVPAVSHETSTLSHEMRVDRQKLR